MTNRVIDLSERPVRLSVRNSLLVIRVPPGAADRAAAAGPSSRRADGEIAEAKTYRCEQRQNPGEQTMPLADVAVVIASHPQVSLTQAVLSGLAAAGGIFVACDTRHMPAAMLLPLATHSLQAERFAAQAALPLPARKRLWQQIVRAKVLAQADLLEDVAGSDHDLRALVPAVRSGDPANVEARAARIYWRGLFGDSGFHRDTDGDGLNAHLNYGYAVLRAITARALCGAGLHPGLGLHHHNRYDAFPLADDLMEPFRPVVDRTVAGLHSAGPVPAALDSTAKRKLLQPLLARFVADGESRTLFDWVSRAASSLAAAMDSGEKAMEVPNLRPDRAEAEPDADNDEAAGPARS